MPKKTLPPALPYYFTTRTKNVIITDKMSLSRFCTGQDTESVKKEGKPMPKKTLPPEQLAAKKALALTVIDRLRAEYPDAACTRGIPGCCLYAGL